MPASPSSSLHPIADALDASHKELETVTKTGLMQTLANAVQALANRDALPVENIAQFKDACLAGAKLFGWDGKAQTEVNITNQVGVVCDQATGKRLIELRKNLLAEQSIKQAVPPALHSVKETQSNASVGAPNANVASNEAAALPKPCTKPQDSPGSGVPQWMQDISGAASWKNGKGSAPEDHVGSLGNEEYDI